MRGGGAPLHRAVGPARRRPRRRARRGARHRRPERLGQEHPAQAAGRDHPPARGHGRGRRPVASMLELGRGLPPRLHRARERLHERRHPRALASARSTSGWTTIIAFSELEDFIDMPVRTYSSGHVHAPRRSRSPRTSTRTCCCWTRCWPSATRPSSASASAGSSSTGAAAAPLVFVSHDAERGGARLRPRGPARARRADGRGPPRRRPGHLPAGAGARGRPVGRRGRGRGVGRVGHPHGRHRRRAHRRTRGADGPVRERRSAGDRDRLRGPRAGGDAPLRRRDPRHRRDPLLRDEHAPRHLPGRVGGGPRHAPASPSTTCRCTRGASCSRSP